MRVKLPVRVSLRPQSLTYLMVILFLVVGFVYVFAVNFVANKGAKIRTLETTNKELQADNERLAVEAARLASLRVIEDDTAPRTVEVGDVDETANQEIVFVPEVMVETQQQRYLPSYSALAQR